MLGRSGRLLVGITNAAVAEAGRTGRVGAAGGAIAVSAGAWRSGPLRWVSSAGDAAQRVLSTREAVEVEETAEQALARVQDPIVKRSVRDLGYIRRVTAERSTIKCEIRLDTLAHPGKAAIEQDIRATLEKEDDLRGLNVDVIFKPKAVARNTNSGIRQVNNIIAVSSCKGGTGKSTVAVNLAYSLQLQGARVGLVDVDVYGPSLPSMISPEDTRLLQMDGGLLEPINYHNVSCMSYGYITAAAGQADKAAVMRGPMASSVASQLVTDTDWGELDFLIMDMPPGTGDIVLTLCQALPISAAVVVTTPHQLSYVDVVKGIQMFDMLKVPTISLVENMSYFECEHGVQYHPFGPGFRAQLTERYGFRSSISLPLSESTATVTANGHPAVLTNEDDRISKEFHELSRQIVSETLHLNHGTGAKSSTQVTLSKDKSKVLIRTFMDDSAAQFEIESRHLRLNCKCASCVDEHTGVKTLDEDAVPVDVIPEKIRPCGNYAVAVEWSDGHTSSIYPYDNLLTLAGERV